MDIFSKPDLTVIDKINDIDSNFSIKRKVINDLRHYVVKDISKNIEIGCFPSVTSILSETKDKEFLEIWRQKKGRENANRISKESTDRGSVMHRLCELYCNLQNNAKSEKKLQEVLKLSKTDKEINSFDTRAIIVGGKLFYNFYMNNFFDNIHESIFQEKFIWNKLKYKDQDISYAGTLDNYSIMLDHKKKIIDFKTAIKNKKEEWIGDYKLQGSAYSMAVKSRYGLDVDGVEIWISNEAENDPQIYTLDKHDIKKYFKQFIERRIEFNKLK